MTLWAARSAQTLHVRALRLFCVAGRLEGIIDSPPFRHPVAPLLLAGEGDREAVGERAAQSLCLEILQLFVALQSGMCDRPLPSLATYRETEISG
jgi:hypothetical protein